MTVKELEAILCTVKNKDLKVGMTCYSTLEVNGYYFTEKDGEEVLMLTNDNVQPRILEQ